MSSAALDLRPSRGVYPEREEPNLGWLDKMGSRVAGAVSRRLRSRAAAADPVIRWAAEHEAAHASLDDAGLAAAARELRPVLRREGFRDELAGRAFALVRETAKRRLGQRHHDVQLRGGWVLLQGMLAEMETGEGKTLTATLPAATAALAGLPVHVITVNDYLAARDAEEMGPIYEALGLRVGLIQHDMLPDERRAAYAADITYCTNKDLTFDYLRDRIALGAVRTRRRLQLESLGEGGSRADRLLLRGLCFGIVDEADSVLIDEARTPLLISEEHDDDEEEDLYETALALAEQLEDGRDFTLRERERTVELTSAGEDRLGELSASLDGLWKGPRRRAQLAEQALTALHLFRRDEHYLLADDKVQIIDEFTGRLMPDRSWERGLHQMIEVKEDCELTGRRETLARISYQRFFRRYQRLAGMTGTAHEVAGELGSVYRLAVVRIPTNRPLLRKELPPTVHATQEAKWRRVVERVRAVHAEGRPVLVGTRSVGASEHLSGLLDAAGLPHRVLNARQDEGEAEVVAQAGQAGRITVATNMAGRGTDIRLDEAARAAGGLHVIATERHEAGRIDRQLFGRCGRQGDPGSFEMQASLEDDLVRAHGGRVASLLTPAARRDDPVGARLRDQVTRRAQQSAERRHSRDRRQLLKTDDQISNLLAFSGRGE